MCTLFLCFVAISWLLGNIDCNCDRYVDVAIIGAGPSGTYSAYRLRNQKLTIEVFEYLNRVGGRLYSTTLPDAPDLPIELGGMVFLPSIHKRVFKVVNEIGLDYKSYLGGIGNLSSIRYYLRGINRNYVDTFLYTYHLREEEKKADNLVKFDEALSLVASDEAKNFIVDSSMLSSLVWLNGSLYLWESLLQARDEREDDNIKTPVEGMNSIPKRLIELFLESSKKHTLTLNRRLMSINTTSINTTSSELYRLEFKHTQTTDVGTTELESKEFVCAKQVILAITKFALSQLDWHPLRDSRVQDAIHAVRNVQAQKVFLTFPTDWWMSKAAYPSLSIISDRPFNYFVYWGQSQVSGHYVTLASYVDEEQAHFLHELNGQGPVINGSTPGLHRVTQCLLDHLLEELAKAFNIDRTLIPEPISSISQYWSTYPFGGSWVVWKNGYRYDDVISTVQRPSLTDNVFYVGADHSTGENPGWTEGAFEAADRVIEKYFL
ncbi:achacin-like isoform X3 [Biomphalaria glabrata]|uniref:Achacin-like isoform X3 n=1 Tax=Biomphalaria glabrata TaxID=6526 RepID=A0A9W2Z9K1_BIOGL|nr:achacin-like isoform X3 [Biomphalaria glabrata]